MEQYQGRKTASDTRRIVGFTMIVAGALLLLLTVFGGLFGSVGKAIRNFFLGVFGFSFFAFCAAAIVLGVFVARGVRTRLPAGKIACIVGIYCCALAVLHLITSSSLLDAGYGVYLAGCYRETWTAGGAFLGIIVWPIAQLTRPVAYLFFIVLGIVLGLAIGGFAMFRRRMRKSPAEAPSDPFVHDPAYRPQTVTTRPSPELYIGEIRVQPSAPPAPIPTVAATPASRPVYVPKPSHMLDPDRTALSTPPSVRPEPVVHGAADARPAIIDGDARERELQAKRDEKERLAKAEERINRELANMRPSPAQRPIINGDELSAQIEERKKQEAAKQRVAEPSPPEPSAILSRGDTKTPIVPPPTPPAPDAPHLRSFTPPPVVHTEPVEPPPAEPTGSHTITETPDDGVDFRRAFGTASRTDAVRFDSPATEPPKPAPVRSAFNLIDLLSGKSTTSAPAAEPARPTWEQKPIRIADEETTDDLSEEPPTEEPQTPDIASVSATEEPETDVPDAEPDDDIAFAEPVTEDEETDEDEPIATEPAFSEPAAPSALQFARQQLGMEDVLAEREDTAPQSIFGHFGPYTPPPTDLLFDSSTYSSEITDELRQKADRLIEKLQEFRLPCSLIGISHGPAVSRFELQVLDGSISVGTFKKYEADLAYTLASSGSVRIEAPIRGRTAVGIEVPNEQIGVVSLREVMESKEYTESKDPLVFALGTDVSGRKIVCNLAKMPHLLVAGSTNSGKSSCLNSMIISLIAKNSPEDLRLMLIDPKSVEFINYEGIPHLLLERPITDWQNALNGLNWLIDEYERRFNKLFVPLRVKNIKEYNSHPDVLSGKAEKLPYIVVIIDEMCDLMSNNKTEFEDKIRRIAQKARAAGIHMVVATQRPSVDVITGTIKANLTSRIAFAVTSNGDSRTILDRPGAELLLGRGDMLYAPIDMNDPIRVQGAYVCGEEIDSVVAYIKEHNEAHFEKSIYDAVYPAPEVSEPVAGLGGGDGTTNGLPDETLPVLWYIIENEHSSICAIQRRFRMGFNKAARIVDDLEVAQYIAPDPEGKTKDRYARISREEFIEKFGEPKW